MNLAHLPWEQLLLDLDQPTVRPPAARKPGQTTAAPLVIYLDAAQRIAAAMDMTPARALGLLADLGINPNGVLARMRMMGPDALETDAHLAGVLSEGSLDLAARAKMWSWEGIVAADVRLTAPDFLLQVRLHGQQMLRWVADQPEAPTLLEVVARLSDSRTRCLVLRWTTQTFALVPGLCAKRGLPTLGRPPLAYASRNRGPPVRPVEQPRAPGGDPGSHLAEDLTAVVAELAIQPARIRQDWVIRVADGKRLAARLGIENPEPSDHRLAQAFTAAYMLNLVRQAAMETHANEAGLAWLRLDACERQRRLVARLRGHMLRVKDKEKQEDHHVCQLMRRITGGYASTSEHLQALGDLAAAWRELGEATWNLSEAISWWARHPPRGSGLHAEAAWGAMLGPGLHGLAIPLGLIVHQGTGLGSTIRLTAAGRWAVGLETEWKSTPAITVDRPIIVQADHTIMFLAPAAAVEVEIGAFADRLPGAHGTGALFKLSKAACRRAAVAGLDAAHALGVLAAATSKPVPANVEREITGWFGQLRQAHATQALVITTADEDTATRLVALLGATRLGPQAVSLPAATRRGELQRRLAKDGILLNGADQQPSR